MEAGTTFSPVIMFDAKSEPTKLVRIVRTGSSSPTVYALRSQFEATLGLENNRDFRKEVRAAECAGRFPGLPTVHLPACQLAPSATTVTAAELSVLKARNAVRAGVSAVNAVVLDVSAACGAARAFIAVHGLPAFGAEEAGVAAALAWFDEAADVLRRVERRAAPVIALPATYPVDDTVWESEFLGALLCIRTRAIKYAA